MKSCFGGPATPVSNIPATQAQIDLLGRVLEVLRDQEDVAEDPRLWAAECLHQLVASPCASLAECVAEANLTTSWFLKQQRENAEETRWKALMHAVASGDIAQVELAVKNGAILSNTALVKAAQRSDPAMVKFLLSVGADVCGVDSSNSAVLSVVTTEQGTEESRAEVFKLLTDAGAPWRTERILSNCALQGNSILLRMILPLLTGDSLNLDGMLQSACAGSNGAAVALLLNHGARITAASFFSAVRSSSLEIIRVLLDHRADATELYLGFSAIDVILNGNLGPDSAAIVSLLIDHGCEWSGQSATRFKKRLKTGLMHRYELQAEDVLSRLRAPKRPKH